MSNGTKLFIVLLFVVGILFVVSINIGALRGDNQSFQKPGWLNSFGSALARPQPLQLADLSPTAANCLQQGKVMLQVGTTCAFTIQKSTFALRVVKFQFVQGTIATASLAQDGTITINQTLHTGEMTSDDFKLYPGKEGKLTLECNDSEGGAPCLLTLK